MLLWGHQVQTIGSGSGVTHHCSQSHVHTLNASSDWQADPLGGPAAVTVAAAGLVERADVKNSVRWTVLAVALHMTPIRDMRIFWFVGPGSWPCGFWKSSG